MFLTNIEARGKDVDVVNESNFGVNGHGRNGGHHRAFADQCLVAHFEHMTFEVQRGQRYGGFGDSPHHEGFNYETAELAHNTNDRIEARQHKMLDYVGFVSRRLKESDDFINSTDSISDDRRDCRSRYQPAKRIESDSDSDGDAVIETEDMAL